MIDGVTEESVKEKNPAEHAVQPELSQLRQFALHGWHAEPPAGR
jgi:hypothetical protein